MGYARFQETGTALDRLLRPTLSSLRKPGSELLWLGRVMA